MKTLNSIILIIASIAIMVSCTCNGPKKTSALTKEQLIDKKFELYSDEIPYNMIYGRWISEDGNKCYDFQENKYDDIVCAYGHHHKLPKSILLVYSRNPSGDYSFAEVWNVSIESNSHYQGPDFPLIGWTDIPYGEEYIEVLCLDSSTSFMQVTPFDWDEMTYITSDWGERYYRDNTLSFPAATQEEIIAYLKPLWDRNCGNNDYDH